MRTDAGEKTLNCCYQTLLQIDDEMAGENLMVENAPKSLRWTKTAHGGLLVSDTHGRHVLVVVDQNCSESSSSHHGGGSANDHLSITHNRKTEMQTKKANTNVNAAHVTSALRHLQKLEQGQRH